MTGLWGDWPRIRARFRRARRVLFLLDFDGTLSPLVGHPANARLEESTRALLRRIVRHNRAKVAVLSGRSLTDIRRRVGLKGISYGGIHGVERSGPGWGNSPCPRPGRRGLSVCASHLHRLVTETPGAWLEDKGVALGLHYRRVARGDMPRLRRRLAPLWRLPPAGYRWARGKKVWELRPRIGDKGAAARRLWLNLKRPWLVAVGDDRTDEDMFRAVGAKGLTIRVGRPRRSRARYRLAGPDDVRCFLKKSLAAMNE